MCDLHIILLYIYIFNERGERNLKDIFLERPLTVDESLKYHSRVCITIIFFFSKFEYLCKHSKGYDGP